MCINKMNGLDHFLIPKTKKQASIHALIVFQDTWNTTQNHETLTPNKYQCQPFSTSTRWCCNVYKQNKQSEPLREQTISKHKKWSCHVKALAISKHKKRSCHVKALTAWALQLQSHSLMSTPPCLKQIRRLQHKDCTTSCTSRGNLLRMYTFSEDWLDSKARTVNHARRDHPSSSIGSHCFRLSL